MLSKQEKSAIVNRFGQHEHDTGSPEVQIAQLTQRISRLTDHLREHKHDYHTRRALMKLVGQRRRQLRYLNREDVNRYSTLVNELGLRR
ncbi:MAG: 30S ribosomal protein S15 [Chloroflexi bacterium]|nr:30S ribosomal protein S15 [Chloroflexota bacterium]MCY3695725.1 30S ribosomal protein S15 [Chloroflexota bacterium]MXX31620.1 30S ribosomal protein S15 [Chloroflexota bacterium]MYD15698.1 30S ribosomal protein S15 [Chloroflexota bacterium]MYJ02132.1 30S ribosomal protein S15 [Chloroflexota bacterium]